MTEQDRETLMQAATTLSVVGTSDNQPGISLLARNVMAIVQRADASRKPPEGTVRVRVAIVVNERGEWNSMGSHDSDFGSERPGGIADFLEPADSECLHFIEADVPVPQSTTIPAEVTT